MTDIVNMREIVQRNCDISDAQYARNYTMCIYLLKMRELYRWEQGLELGERLPGQAVGSWVAAREHRWDGLEDEEFDCLPIVSGCADPFESATINDQLTASGCVYGGGIGRLGKPHFFLGRLDEVRRHEDLRVFLCGEEYARDLTAPPAMAQGRHLFVRRESLRRMLWEMIEDWRWKRRPGPVADLVAAYDFDREPRAALEVMTESQIELVVRHELGEAMAARELGADWERMLAGCLGSVWEIKLRACRDHLADSLSTLPYLVTGDELAPVHFFFANLQGERKQLWPRAERIYQRWRESGEYSELARLADSGGGHWLRICRALLDAWGAGDVRNPESAWALILASAVIE